MMTGGQGSPPVPAGWELLIDRQLPQFEARTFSSVVVDAGPERTYQAVHAGRYSAA